MVEFEGACKTSSTHPDADNKTQPQHKPRVDEYANFFAKKNKEKMGGLKAVKRVSDGQHARSDSYRHQYEGYNEEDYEGYDYGDYAYGECFEPAAVEEVLHQCQPNDEHYDVCYDDC